MNVEDMDVEDLEDLAELNGIDEYDLEKALSCGTYKPAYAEELGITIVDDEWEDDPDWTIAIVFKLGGKGYGYYKDGSSKILNKTDAASVAEWASEWDPNHLPDLLAEVMTRDQSLD